MAIGDAKDFEGQTRPSVIEKEAYEGSLCASRITEIPSNMQMRCDYDTRTDGQPVYLGFAPKGLGSSFASIASGWLIHKFSYDASDRVTLRQIGYGVWDTRASTITYA